MVLHSASHLADRSGVETVVDEVLEVLAHANLTHKAVLVAVHASELTHMRESVLQTIGQLERIHVAEAVLHHRID